jgi:hypothetical protein
MYTGNDVIILDTTNKSERNVIQSVIDINTVKLETPTIQFYYHRDIPLLEVVSNTFTNNHTHQIRENQLEYLNIADYLEHGYPSSHSHEPLPFIKNVAKTIMQANNAVAVGSSKVIYVSNGSSNVWSVLIDLGDLITNQGVTEVTDITFDSNGNFVVGTGNGYVIVENNSSSVVPLEQPII